MKPVTSPVPEMSCTKFVGQVRNSYGVIVILRKGFDWVIKQASISAQSGNPWDKVVMKFYFFFQKERVKGTK